MPTLRISRHHRPAIDATSPKWLVTPEQKRRFDLLGFLVLPRLFASEIQHIARALEETLAESEWHVLNCALYDATRTGCEKYKRVVIDQLLDRSSQLAWLKNDARLHALSAALLGDGHGLADSDGNLYNGDTSWHSDGFWACGEGRYMKLMLYLDPLTPETGALRILPGSHLAGAFGDTLRCHLLMESRSVDEIFGCSPEQLPAACLSVNPGDAIVLDPTVFHASLGGARRRRLITMDFGPVGTRLPEERKRYFARAAHTATRSERAELAPAGRHPGSVTSVNRSWTASETSSRSRSGSSKRRTSR